MVRPSVVLWQSPFYIGKVEQNNSSLMSTTNIVSCRVIDHSSHGLSGQTLCAPLMLSIRLQCSVFTFEVTRTRVAYIGRLLQSSMAHRSRGLWPLLIGPGWPMVHGRTVCWSGTQRWCLRYGFPGIVLCIRNSLR